MTDPVQLGLLGDDLPLDGLGERQRAGMAFVRDHAPASGDEVGAAIHAARGKHPDDVRCAFCLADGAQVLLALRAKGLVEHRRGIGWVPSGFVPSSEGEKSEPRYDPSTAEIAF